MRRQAFVLVAACLMFGVAQAPAVAQSGKTASGWKCAAPSPAHAVPVGDSPDRMLSRAADQVHGDQR